MDTQSPHSVNSQGPIAPHLLPETATATTDDELVIGGVEVAALASEYGTPLFVYDEEHLRNRCREAVEVFGPDGAIYASKAFLCRAMAKLVHEEGMRIDVATDGELAIALASGVPAERLELHGNNKSLHELRTALTVGVGRIVVDSFDEFDRIAALVGQFDSSELRTKLLIRINPGIEVHTHEHVQTGNLDSKFGFPLSTGDAERALERGRSLSGLELVGIHLHIGSQVFSVENFLDGLGQVAPFVIDTDLPELVVGGGLGVAYTGDEQTPSLQHWGQAILNDCERVGIRAQISAEPGRSIVATAGVTVYEVGTIKAIPDVRTYVSVDGGMSDNPRPIMYDSAYEAFLANGVSKSRTMNVQVAGKHCESGDFVVRSGWLPADTAIGDLLVTPVTGAYGMSMASNYNKVQRPAVVFVADGTSRLVIRRETVDDLLITDVG